MRVHEYLEQATAYIANPATAVDVRRELQAHLDEAILEATAQGLDPESAELVAVGRMGSPESVAVQLGAMHHTHLPWRLYLAPIPLIGLTVLAGDWAGPWNPWVVRCLWGLMLFSLIPGRATAKRWLGLLHIDLMLKFEWLTQQAVRPALVAGGVGGLVAGIAFSGMPIINDWVYRNGYYDMLVPRGLWNLLGGLSWLLMLWPLVPGVLAVVLVRRFVKGDLLLTGAFAALAYPLGAVPSLGWLGSAPTVWLFFDLIFAGSALAMGWMARAIQQRRVAANS